MRRLAYGLLVPLVMLGFVGPVAAGDAGLTNSETFSGFQFNFNNPGARALGMGGAFVAVADDATAVVANPAGLTILQRPEISAEYKFTRFTQQHQRLHQHARRGHHQHGARPATSTTASTRRPSSASCIPTERVVRGRLRPGADQLQEHLQHRGRLPHRSRPAARCQRLLAREVGRSRSPALNFGLGAGVNLEKENPWLPNIGVSLEFSFGRISSRLERFGTFGRHRAAGHLRPARRPRPSTAPISASGSTSAAVAPDEGPVVRRRLSPGPQYDMTFRRHHVARAPQLAADSASRSPTCTRPAPPIGSSSG